MLAELAVVCVGATVVSPLALALTADRSLWSKLEALSPAHLPPANAEIAAAALCALVLLLAAAQEGSAARSAAIAPYWKGLGGVLLPLGAVLLFCGGHSLLAFAPVCVLLALCFAPFLLLDLGPVWLTRRLRPLLRKVDSQPHQH